MLNFWTRVAVRVAACLFAGVIGVSSLGTLSSQTPESEQTLWTIEHNYWSYVQNNNLAAYRSLWHNDFLGWPSVSAAPVRKDHITDWITSQTGNGMTFKAIGFKPAAIQLTGNLAVTYYWETFKWEDKNHAGATITLRVTHTWIKNGRDWQIIGGMSMPEPATQ
jgi:hypothetical protein